MEKLPVSLDSDALRSFVLGIECGSFALAAQQLCRSTSAVSAQLKKLEQQCGMALVTKRGRHLVPTEGGEMLLSYARRLIALNDEAWRAVRGELLQGDVRIGMQEDFGESLMPGILGPFSRQHPGVRISARVDRNQPLLQSMAEKSLDMALLWQGDDLPAQSQLLGQTALTWIGAENMDIADVLKRGEALPLVMFEAPCLMRTRAITVLEQAGIAWRVVFTSHSLSGIWAAVQAGLGVTLRSHIGLPAYLSPLTAPLPSPGHMGIALLQHQPENATQQMLSQLTRHAVASFLQSS
ncbi:MULTISPECIES: LysR substrate-binding domain-containing protein [unclassified Pantoea]|uniref:LysR substrate-binding domain-containing protein n=1 Tax=unclassified Pantoea TaxID=2630326 RepID=UPI001CD7FD82|nr:MULTISPECIES: LysR substrate-binding domain-containing protein [unclassified Pantoea]MCA1177348.1 LysR family transcriptional regulator [Pantoea sp. alder69]MCA1249746.1 LysR family transcriptional regulator [Pantoea sp. alder70]MCA1265837.1 LysR family transcriptional regulator [Pantoea sp. alder81]